MTEEKDEDKTPINNVKSSEKVKETKSDIISALQTGFATTVNRIYINSLGKDLGFREITVLEQKTLSRVMIDNESRKDVVFDAQCALINTVCLDEGFDIYKLTEFDRLKLLVAIYQANMYKNDVTFTCPHCNAFNAYKLDFDNVVKKLDSVDIAEKKFTYENKNFSYIFNIAYPSVKFISAFHKANIQKYRGVSKQKIKAVDNDSLTDYVNLYIKDISVTSKVSGFKKDIHLEDFDTNEILDIISIFPQDVLYSENGVLKYITIEFIKKVNDAFEAPKCAQCGETYEEEVINSASSFL